MILRVSVVATEVDHLSRCRYVRACSVRGPLYPLNALMLHGLIYAQHAKNLSTDPANDFADEVRDYFGTGTQLQEMYITPSLLSKENWDVLARRRSGRGTTPVSCAIRTGSAEIRRNWKSTVGLRGRRRRQSSSCGTRATSHSGSHWTSGRHLRFPEMRPRTLRRRARGQKTAPCQLFDSVQASRMCFRWRRSKC